MKPGDTAAQPVALPWPPEEVVMLRVTVLRVTVLRSKFVPGSWEGGALPMLMVLWADR